MLNFFSGFIASFSKNAFGRVDWLELWYDQNDEVENGLAAYNISKADSKLEAARKKVTFLTTKHVIVGVSWVLQRTF